MYSITRIYSNTNTYTYISTYKSNTLITTRMIAFLFRDSKTRNNLIIDLEAFEFYKITSIFGL